MGTKTLRTLASLVAICCVFPCAFGQEWADLSIQINFNGPPPPAKMIPAAAAVAGCGPIVLDETFVVGPNGGLRDVMIWLVPDKGSQIPVHPDVEKAVAETAVILDNNVCKFVGHAVTMSVGQKLVLKNSDAIGHNTKCDFSENKPFNVIIPAMGEVVAEPVKKVEKRPTPIACNIHPWMSANLMVAPTPYHGVTSDLGMVEIKNVPVGEWTFKIWHAGIGNVAKATDTAGKTVEWKKGEAKFKLAVGANDLGTYKVAPKK